MSEMSTKKRVDEEEEELEEEEEEEEEWEEEEEEGGEEGNERKEANALSEIMAFLLRNKSEKGEKVRGAPVKNTGIRSYMRTNRQRPKDRQKDQV